MLKELPRITTEQTLNKSMKKHSSRLTFSILKANINQFAIVLTIKNS